MKDEDIKWYEHEKDKINLERCKCAAPFDNIFVTPTPRDGLTKESADSFDAIINVCHSPEVLFQPSRPDQRTYWYPVNELGEWSYAYFAYMFKVLDYHYDLGHRIIVHCLPRYTRVLTSLGYKNIEDVTHNDSVANFDHETGRVFFARPKALVRRPLLPDEKMIRFSNDSVNRSIECTSKHRMAYRPSMGITASDTPSLTTVKDHVWSARGMLEASGSGLSKTELLMIPWIVGDGSIELPKRKTKEAFRINFNLSRERKIARLRSILVDGNISYSECLTRKGKVTRLSINQEDSYRLASLVGFKAKEYPMDLVWKLTDEEAKILVDELAFVGGDWNSYQNRRGFRLNTAKSKDLDFLCAITQVHFGATSLKTRNNDTNFKKNRTLHYINSVNNKTLEYAKSGYHNTTITKTDVEYSDDVFCLETDSGYFLVEQNGSHFVTGNCHAGAYRSPTIVRCWLRYKGFCVEEAYDIVTGYMRDFNTEKDEGRFRNFALFQGYKMGNYPPNFDLYLTRLKYHKEKSYSYIAAMDEPDRISLRPEVLPRGYHYKYYLRRKYFGWFLKFKSWLKDRKEQLSLFLVGERRVYISRGYSTVIYPDEKVATILRKVFGNKKAHPYDDTHQGYKLKKSEFIKLEREKKEEND